MAAKRKFYKALTVAIAELLHSKSFGDFHVIGPHEDDGCVVIIRRTATVTEAWIMTPDGTLGPRMSAYPDPREFGYRGALTNG